MQPVYARTDAQANSDQLRRIANRDLIRRYAEVADIFTLRQWDAVLLRFECGLSQKAIAEVLGTSRGAVSNLLNRAARRLREHQRKLRAEAFREQRQALMARDRKDH